MDSCGWMGTVWNDRKEGWLGVVGSGQWWLGVVVGRREWSGRDVVVDGREWSWMVVGALS